MKELEKYFIQRNKDNQKGIEYTQMIFTDYAYLYKKCDLESNQTTFLTFKRIEDSIIGRVKFPQDHDLAKWAFEYQILQNALDRFRELNCETKN